MSEAIKDLPKEGATETGKDISISADDKPFDIAAFKSGEDTSVKIENKEIPKVDEPAKAPVKEEPKKEVELKKEEPKEPPKEEKPASEEFVPQPMTSLKKPSTSKDFDGLNEVEIDFGKRMEKGAFDFYKARLLENRELKTKLKETEEKYTQAATRTTVANHEQGYILDSRYQEAAVAIERESAILSHWRKQLANVLEAKDWHDLDFNEKGEIITIPKKASANDQIYLQEKIAAATQIVQHNRMQAAQIQQNHKQLYSEKAKAIKQMEDYMFPEFGDDKAFEANKFGKGMLGLLVRAGEEKNILSNPLRKLYAMAMQWKEEADAAEAELEKIKKIGIIKKDNLTAAEINKGAAPATPTVGEDAPFDPNVWEKIKANS